MTAPFEYAEDPPPAALAPFVEAIWSLSARPTPEAPLAQLVRPDGCVDLLVDRTSGRARLVGAMTRPLEHRAERPVELVAVRFAPGGAAALLGTPVHELTDDVVETAAIEPSLRALFEGLAELLASVPPRGGRRRLGDRIAETAAGRPEPDARVRAAARALSARPAASVASLASSLGVSRQHLTRRFREAVGIGPKRFARISRMRWTLERLPAWPGSLADLALEGGYADQAHMTSELGELAGATPAALARGFHSSKTPADRDRMVCP